MDILYKIQNLPERTKKIILWLVLVIVGLSLVTWYLKNFQKRIKNPQKEKFWEELKLPKIEMPKIYETELKKLEEQLKEK